MVSPPTEEIMRKRLMSVNSTQESVQTCSKWLLHHRESIDKIANCWMDIYKQSMIFKVFWVEGLFKINFGYTFWLNCPQKICGQFLRTKFL